MLCCVVLLAGPEAGWMERAGGKGGFGIGIGWLLATQNTQFREGGKMRKDAEVSRCRRRRVKVRAKSNWRIGRKRRLVCVSEKLGSRMGGST